MELKEIGESLIKGETRKVESLVKQALEEKFSAEEVLNQGLIAGMEVVGKKFKAGEIFIPEVLVAARAMQAGTAVLEPLLAQAGVTPLSRVAIGTVKGDLHDIGKNLVAMMWRGAGLEVIDLGIDVSPAKFVEVATQGEVRLIGMSALLTTTMPVMRVVIEELEKAGLREKVKVMIGGAPVTQEYAQEIGADGYAPDAGSAVDKAKELLGLDS